LYGGFVWARGALNSQKRRFPAWAVVAGDTNGRWSQLMKTVGSANSKAGPFDALFCVGTFFGPGSAEALAPYLRGEATVPVPTYFITGAEDGEPPVALPEDGAVLCPNLTYLGRQGVKEVAGLDVAFLSGVHDAARLAEPRPREGYDAAYRQTDVDWLKSKTTAATDLLLTAEWAEGFHEMLAANPLPEGAPPPSAALGHVMETAAPRYHLAGRAGVYLQMKGYRNALPQGVTLFYGLGANGNAAKAKSLLALQVKLRQKLVTGEQRAEQAELHAKATDNPYTSRGAAAERAKVAAAEEASPAFIPAKEFTGRRDGYAFKVEGKGPGWWGKADTENRKLGYWKQVGGGPMGYGGLPPAADMLAADPNDGAGPLAGGAKRRAVGPAMGTASGKLFVSGISWKTSDAELSEAFERFGAMSECRVAVDRDGRRQGYAFVTYKVCRRPLSLSPPACPLWLVC
jgi:hypothetical protein